MIYIFLAMCVLFILTGILLSRYEEAKQRRERKLRLRLRARRCVSRRQY